jgi:hypothetical protein
LKEGLGSIRVYLRASAVNSSFSSLCGSSFSFKQNRPAILPGGVRFRLVGRLRDHRPAGCPVVVVLVAAVRRSNMCIHAIGRNGHRQLDQMDMLSTDVGRIAPYFPATADLCRSISRRPFGDCGRRRDWLAAGEIVASKGSPTVRLSAAAAPIVLSMWDDQ